jgi:hypothetical protein
MGEDPEGVREGGRDGGREGGKRVRLSGSHAGLVISCVLVSTSSSSHLPRDSYPPSLPLRISHF